MLKELLEAVNREVARVNEEATKVEAGNKAAGVRLRTSLLRIKSLCSDVRKKSLEMKESQK